MQFVGWYFDNSIEAGSDHDKAIARAPRDNKIQVSMGLSERAGGTLYIAQWHYGDDGELIKRRRKLKPTHVERTVFDEGDGSDWKVSDTAIGGIGQLYLALPMRPEGTDAWDENALASSVSQFA